MVWSVFHWYFSVGVTRQCGEAIFAVLISLEAAVCYRALGPLALMAMTRMSTSITGSHGPPRRFISVKVLLLAMVLFDIFGSRTTNLTVGL
jgi:hypothetical protein